MKHAYKQYAALAVIAAATLVTNGGYSLTLDAQAVTTGYAVADGQNEQSFSKPDTQFALARIILDYIASHPLKSGEFYGGWLDEHTGKVYLDKSEQVADLETAKRLGLERKQLAVFDLGTLETLYM